MSSVAEALPVSHEAGVTTQNPFEILKVYDVPEFDLGPEVSTEQTEKAAADDKKAIAMVDYKAEESDDEKGLEMFLAFCTLFRDITAIRTHVKSLWTSYAKGELSLSAVSVATNTAVDLARRMEEDVADLFRNVEDGMHGLLFSFYTACCVAEGKNPLDIRPPDDYNMSTYGLVDYTMNNAAKLLTGWSDTGPDGPSTYNGKFGW